MKAVKFSTWNFLRKKGFQFTDFISLGDEFQQNPMVKAGKKKNRNRMGCQWDLKQKKMVIEVMISWDIMGYNGGTGVIKHCNWTRFYGGVSRWGNPLAMLDDTGRPLLPQ